MFIIESHCFAWIPGPVPLLAAYERSSVTSEEMKTVRCSGSGF